jgi:hypothetical protein
MNKQLVLKENQDMMVDIQNTQKMCQALMMSPHYKKMASEGVFAIVEKARSIGVNPLDALNGGMYYVQGKVEMSAAMMNQLIRFASHSITKDKKSDDTICILHGKRRDNGDTWVESFSIEDAKKAGIYRNQWIKYPKDMLFARALSRLARQLFPDVIKGCYVQGEIVEDAPFKESIPVVNGQESPVFDEKGPVKEIISLSKVVSDKEFEELENWLGDNEQLRANILTHLKRKFAIEDLRFITRDLYELALQRAKEQFGESEQILGEETQMEEA